MGQTFKDALEYANTMARKAQADDDPALAALYEIIGALTTIIEELRQIKEKTE